MQITATPTTSTAASSAATNQALTGISGSDFMKILIKQLECQDPFEPMTNQEMIAQMSTIRQLEMNTQLTESLQRITDQERFSSAAGLIGKQVKGSVSDSEGNEYELAGVVTGIEFTKTGDVLLRLDSGLRMPLTGLTEVVEPQAVAES